MLQLLIFALPGFWGFLQCRISHPPWRVIAFSASCFSSLEHRDPKRTSSSTLHPPLLQIKRDILGESTWRERFLSSMLSLLLSGCEGRGQSGVYSLHSVHWGLPRCLNCPCTLTRIVHIKSALTNFLQQYLKFVYYFTFSEHFHVHFFIHLLLTRMNGGGQEVCEHFHLIGMESQNQTVKCLSSAVLSAGCHIPTVTRSAAESRLFFNHLTVSQ